MPEIGVIHGRFQVLHNDHLKYLMAGKARCRHLVVGITNPDPTQTREDSADLHRSSPVANPLNYFERYTMVRAAIFQAGVPLLDFSVVPFPVNLPELYKYYVPIDGTFFLTIYDQWGRRKLELFQSLRLKTEILWEKPLHKKGLSAGDIRERMAVGEPWEDLVPPSTRLLMKKWDIPERLKKVHQQ